MIAAALKFAEELSGVLASGVPSFPQVRQIGV
jgi:hypothetical protein